MPAGGVPLPGFVVAQGPEVAGCETQKKATLSKPKKEKLADAFSFGRKGITPKKKHQRSLSSSSQQSDAEETSNAEATPVLRRHMSLKATGRNHTVPNNDRMSFPNLNTMWRSPSFGNDWEITDRPELKEARDAACARSSSTRSNSYKSTMQTSLPTQKDSANNAANDISTDGNSK